MPTNNSINLPNGTTGQLVVGVTGAAGAYASSASADFTFTSATAAVLRTLTVSSTDNTSASTAANIQTTVGGGTAGDPQHTFTVTGATSWSQGIDNSASDAYKISASTALGTTDTVVITPAGAMTRPLQPAFAAYNDADQANVTGDGTVYTILYNTELFDLGNNFASNTFTAPVTGRYFLGGSINIYGIGAQTYLITRIVTTGRTVIVNRTSLVAAAFANMGFSFGIFLPMTAMDTATIILEIGGSTKTVDISSADTIFYGYLVA